MSQKKVDAYKAQKANRGKNSKKEKLIYMIESSIGMAIVCIVVVWIGFSIYDKATEKEVPESGTVTETVIDTSALDEVVADLSAASEVEE